MQCWLLMVRDGESLRDGKRAGMVAAFENCQPGLLFALTAARSAGAQVAGTKGGLELFDFVLPKREDTCAYCVRDDAFAAELDTKFIQGTTERQARAPYTSRFASARHARGLLLLACCHHRSSASEAGNAEPAGILDAGQAVSCSAVSHAYHQLLLRARATCYAWQSLES